MKAILFFPNFSFLSSTKFCFPLEFFHIPEHAGFFLKSVLQFNLLIYPKLAKFCNFLCYTVKSIFMTGFHNSGKLADENNENIQYIAMCISQHFIEFFLSLSWKKEINWA